MKKIDKEKNFISAIVYVNNNEKIIERFLNNLIDILDNNFLQYEIICVNDCSFDNSYKLIKKVSDDRNTTINVINMSYNQGRELAMNAGIDMSIGDFVYEFDTLNIDYDLKTIIDIYKKSLEGYDIVCARPNKPMRFSSSIFYKLFNKFSHSEFNLSTDTIRILSRRAINRIHSINKTNPYRKALYVKCGLKMIYFDYDIKNSKYSKISKNLKNERKKNASDALVLFTDLFYKISLFITIIMMLITFGVGIYTIVVFISKNPVAGWTTTMLFLSFCFFILFVMISVIMKYLSIIIQLLFKNNKYLIASIDKLN